MKTDALIDALSADHAVKPAGLARGLTVGIVAGGAAALVLYALLLGPRPDIAAAVHSVRFLFKFVFALALAFGAGMVALRMLRPGVPAPLWLLAVAPALLAIAVGLELLALPSQTWAANMFAATWRTCLLAIPLLSIGPLIALLLTMRRGAATNPAGTGAVIGLLSGGIGAFVYASHCPGDSPFFVAAWYSAAIAFMALIGALAGHRMLRW